MAILETIAPQWISTTCLAVLDLATLSTVYAVAVVARHTITPTYGLKSLFDLLPLLFMILGGFWVQGLYPSVLVHPAEEIRKIYVAATAVFLVMTGTTFMWRTAEAYSRSVFLLTWAAGPPIVLLARYLLRTSMAGRPWWGVPAIVLGSGLSARRVLKTLESRDRGVRVVGVLSDDTPTQWPSDFPPVLGPLRLASVLSRTRNIQYIIVALPPGPSIELKHVIQDYCHGFNHVLLVPDMQGLCTLGVSARDLNGEVGLELPQKLFHRNAFLLKRLIDFAIATLGITALLPLLIAVGIAIKITSRGPIFYRHTRYGRNERTFQAFKFRTMVVNSDKLLADHFASNPEQLFEWERDRKLRTDPRVTTVGRWLRRFSLDELPQLLNVLLGHMSLVGPRPIVEAEITKYGKRFGLYSRVLPGITGLWQVSGRNNTTYEERVAFDEFYVNNWSVWLDVYILLRTTSVVLNADGAY